MFELLRREPDGISTLIRIFRDDQEKEIDQFILDLELQRATQEFKRLVISLGLEHKLTILRPAIERSGSLEAVTAEEKLKAAHKLMKVCKIAATYDEEMAALAYAAERAKKLINTNQYVVQRIG